MRNIAILMVLLLALGASATAFAAPGDESEAGLINQGEMAQMLVKALGLYRYLPPDPTNADCFDVLMINKVSPLNGWEATAAVTREDLARVIILSMGEEASVENPDDPQSWVAALQGMGVDIESVGQVIRQVPPQKDFKSSSFGPAEGDPLKRQDYMTQPDERELQSDLGFVGSVPLTLDEFKYVLRGLDPNDYKPSAVTPN